ncbi:DNA-directed RNA polymerase subunit B [compost metagenome]
MIVNPSVREQLAMYYANEGRNPVELHPELMSLYGLNPLIRHISASRAAMFTGNLAQMVVIKEPSRKRIMSLMERPFADTTFSIEFDDNVKVLKIIPRFGHTAGANRIRHSPQTAIIYENNRTGEIGVKMLTDYHVTHQHFGTEFKRNRDVLDIMRENAYFKKGTKLAQSPLIDQFGNYMYGRETNVLMASDVAGTEDGVKARRGYLEKLAPTGFETRVFEFGREFFPTNQSPNPDIYKVMPDLGEKVSSTGLLVALRRYDPISAVANMTVEALQQPDYIFDRKRFVQHIDAEVVDIKVERNTSINIPPLPVGMEDQLYKYYNADTEFYKKIVDFWSEKRRDARRRGFEDLPMEPEFSHLVYEAIGRVTPDYIRSDHGFNRKVDDAVPGGKVDKVYRGVKLDAWRVEITFKYLSIPNKGYKITDINGNKSVVVEVVEDEDMPVDENGIVADIVVDPNSRWNRVTPASPIEMVISGAARDLGKRIQGSFGFDMNIQLTEDEVNDVVFAPENRDLVEASFAELMEFYKVVAPYQHEDLSSPDYHAINPEYMHTQVAAVILDHMLGLDLAMPTDNPVHMPDVIRTIQERWPPFITPVRFRGRDGKMKVSREPMLIAPSYYINLEKTAEDSWMAASSAKCNVFGTTARLSNNDKYDSPGRQSSIRVGESEYRSEAATCGGEAIADQKDASNNPIAHKFVLRRLLTHPTPTNIEEVLDRKVVPVGGHRPLAYMRNMFECSGKQLTNE